MLNGLEATELKLSDTLTGINPIRIDAEHYRKEYKRIKERLQAIISVPLNQLISSPVMTGHTPSMSNEAFYGGAINFVKTDNLRDNYIASDFTHTLSELGNQEIVKTSLKEKDVIVTIIGATFEIVGRACMVTKEVLPANINQNIALIRTNDEILPEYLSIYLNTEYGKKYLHYLSRQTEQVNLNCREVEQLLVPVIPTIQSRIKQFVDVAHRKLEQSKALYAEAESLLLDDLGLKGWQSSDENISVKSFAQSFGSKGRIDAEYYQPKYQKAMSILNRSGKRIADVADLAKDRFNPAGLDSFDYVEIGNLSGDGSAEAEKVLTEDTPSRAQWIVKTNDVITSTVRPIRRLSALIEKDQDGFICSSGFAVLRPKAIKPELLLVFLRVPIVSVD